MFALLAGVSGAWAQDATVHSGVTYYWRLKSSSYSYTRYIKSDGTKGESISAAGKFKLEDAGDGYFYIHETTTDKYIYTTEALAITNLSESGGTYSNDAQVILTGAKEATDYFKWSFSEGNGNGNFYISPKASSNAVIAVMSSGDNKVNYYQTSSGYHYANSQFIPVNDETELASAVATINSGSTYRIFTKNNGNTDGETKYYMTTDGHLTNDVASAGNFTFTATTTAKYVAAGCGWFISGASTRYFTNPEKSERVNYIKRSTKTAGTERQDWDAQVLYQNGEGLFAVRATNASISDLTWHPAVYWTVEDNGNTLPDADYTLDFDDKHYVWQLEKPITYKLLWNEEPIASCTKTIYQSVGDAAIAASDASMFGAAPAYCSYSAASVSTIGKETTEVTYTLNWDDDAPFEISSDFNTATWYYMNVGGYWISMNSTTKRTELNNSQVQNTNAIWAFKGNPFDGIKIMNLEAGDGYYVDFVNPATVSNTPSYELCYLKENGGNPYFQQDVYFVSIVSGPVLSVAGAWTVNCNLTFDAVDFKALSLDFIDEYASTHALGHYFGVSTSTYSVTRTMYENAGSVSGADYKQLVLYPALQLPTSYPSTGYYRIKNNNTGNYMAYGTPYGYSLSDPRPAGLIATSTSDDAASVIKLTGSKGTYKLSAQGLNIQSQTSANVAFPGSADTGVDFVFNVSSPSVVSITNADSRVNENNDGSLHEATVNWTVHGVVNWQASDDNSKWKVEDATTVTVPLTYISDNNASYATLYLPFGATITGAQAYILTVSGEWAIPSEITEIPANTGVLLRAEGNVASATVTINDAATADTEGNMLAGTNIEITTDRSAGEYILGNGEDGLGFYQRKSGRKIGANKAYLQLDADLAVKGLLLNWDDVDAIRSIDNSQEPKANNQIFNLAGQRMSRLQKGVNIVNGKKVLVK